MLPPARPANEPARLAALADLGILDTPPEERFDRLTRLAQRIFGVPIALVSLIDADRQWFKSRQGLGATETPRDVSFCGHAILGDEPFVVQDARDDERFADNPLVTGAPNVTFYAGQPLKGPGGHKVGTLCLIAPEPRNFDGDEAQVLRDLAALVESELATVQLHEAHARLRTAQGELAARNAELAQARAEADAANAAKSDFLAGMSHELRTPLNAILGYSEMLVEDALDLGFGAAVPDLQRINAAGKHLLGLLNDVLDLSKVEAGRMDACVSQIDVPRFLDEVAHMARSQVERAGNALVVEVGELPPVVRTDETRLRQILLNLLSNAGKFTKDGTVTLRAAAEGAMLRIDVADTGIGMTAEQLSRLFQRFSQAEATTARDYGGTGLGLALSRAFAQLLGGDVDAVSVAGRGTTMTLRVAMRLDGPASPLPLDDVTSSSRPSA